jgi:hypothetical protein
MPHAYNEDPLVEQPADELFADLGLNSGVGFWGNTPFGSFAT